MKVKHVFLSKTEIQYNISEFLLKQTPITLQLGNIKEIETLKKTIQYQLYRNFSIEKMLISTRFPNCIISPSDCLLGVWD